MTSEMALLAFCALNLVMMISVIKENRSLRKKITEKELVIKDLHSKNIYLKHWGK